MLIETDILLAAINPNDPLRSYALAVLEHQNLRLSPYLLLEIHLLDKAKKLDVRDFDAFADDLEL